jgi:hypothetical protein
MVRKVWFIIFLTAALSWAASRSYPQIYTPDDTLMNLAYSTAFKIRYQRFLNELYDSTHSFKSDFTDSLHARIIYKIWVSETGAVDSVAVKCPDSLDEPIAEEIKKHVSAWQFYNAPAEKLKIIQDLGATRKSSEKSFLDKNRNALLVGAGLFVLLLLFL